MSTQVKQDKNQDSNLLLIFGGVLLLAIGGYLAYILLGNSEQDFAEIEGFTFKYAGDMRCITRKTKGQNKPDTWLLKRGDSTKIAICRLGLVDLLTQHTEKSTLKSKLDLFPKKFPSITEQLATYNKIDPRELKLERLTYKTGEGKNKQETELNYISLPVKHPKGGGLHIECYCLKNHSGGRDIMILFLDKRENLSEPSQGFKKMKKRFISSGGFTTNPPIYSDCASDIFADMKTLLTTLKED